jgi:hypothetical protein
MALSIGRLCHLTIVAGATWLATVATAGAFQMDIPCLPIDRSEFVAALLADGMFSQQGYGRFVATDGFVVDTSGMRDYCYEAPAYDIPLSFVMVQGPTATYSISIARFRSPAAADRYFAATQAGPPLGEHLVRSSPTNVVGIIWVAKH